MAQQSQSAPTIIRLKQVKQRTGLSRSSIYLAMNRGSFPRKIALGARSVGWIEEEIDSFLRTRIDASRATQVQQ